MSVSRVRFVGSPITHLVAWYDDVGGYVRCEIDFVWLPNDNRTNARTVAKASQDDCDCMTCLITARSDDMIEVKHDVYAEGAAIAHGASAQISDLVSECARNRFKKAFHETLVSWLIHSNQENRNWARKMIEIVSACLDRGASPEEARDEVEKVARKLGYL